MSKIEPIDFDRCQVEKPNGNTFMTLGGVPGMIRCKAVPKYIVREKESGEDGERGHMSMCVGCFNQFLVQMPNANMQIWRLEDPNDERRKVCPKCGHSGKPHPCSACNPAPVKPPYTPGTRYGLVKRSNLHGEET